MTKAHQRTRQRNNISYPSYLIEYTALEQVEYIAGIDEVGRGAIAGPVVACVVLISKEHKPLPGIHDSKKLTPIQRKNIFDKIKEDQSLVWTIGIASNQEIDNVGIRKATYLAMMRAFWQLPIRPDITFVDGQRGVIPLSARNVFYYTKGDAKLYSIALASIIAKVVRDDMMVRLDELYPQYGFARNKGYGTRAHQHAIKEFGPSVLHRKSFLSKVL